MMLVGVSHHECDFGRSRVIEPVVAPNRNQLPSVLHDQGHAVHTIHVGEMRYLVGPQLHMWIEVPKFDGPGGKKGVEPQQVLGIGRAD